MLKKTNFALIFTLGLISSCSYTISKRTPLVPQITSVSQEITNCAYSPFWFPPLDETYANIDFLMVENKISEIYDIEHKIYPFGIFTKYCIVIKGA